VLSFIFLLKPDRCPSGGEGGIPSPFLGEPLWVPAVDILEFIVPCRKFIEGGEGGIRRIHPLWVPAADMVVDFWRGGWVPSPQLGKLK
jgi:hypothetical protein